MAQKMVRKSNVSVENDEMEFIQTEETLIGRVNNLSVQDRAVTRESYRELISIAQGANVGGEAAFVDISVINKGIEESNRVFGSGQVLLPTEGTYDAEALKHYSELFRQKVLSQKDESLQFNSIEYATRLVSQMKMLSGNEANAADGYPTAAQWAEFGGTVGSFFRRAPAFHYLYGGFSHDVAATQQSSGLSQTQSTQGQATQASQPAAAAVKVKKERQALRSENAPLVQPKTVGNAADVTESEETTKMVDLVWKRLQVLYSKNGNSPVSYFELVLDPESFVQTVENMFYVSFLVKDGKVGIDLDETGLPVLSNSTDTRAGPKPNAADYNQCIMTLNKETWRELVEAFNVTQAVLDFKH